MSHLREGVMEQGDPAVDPKAFRRCLGQFSTGVTVITTVCNGEALGVTANSFSSLSIEPPLILWSIRNASKSLSAFTSSKHFAVNVLAVDQVAFSQRFATSLEKKFDTIAWRPGVLGSPILPDILASLECELETTVPGGDHVILIGRVRQYTRQAGNPLLYSQGRYAVAEDHPTLSVKANPSNTLTEMPAGEQRFMALMGYVWMYASDAFDKYRQTQGLNLVQSRILFALSGGKALRLEEIMRRSFIPQEPAEDAIDSLAVHGFVARKDDAFRLTESGRDLFARLVAQIERFELEQLAGIAKDDIDAARRVLETLYGRLKPSSS